MKNLTTLLILLAFGCNPQTPAPIEPVMPVVRPEEPSNTTLSPLLTRLLQLHNDNRTTPLTPHDALTAAAQGHSDWMASTRRMSHRGANGSRYYDRIRAAGYQASSSGENVAMWYQSAEAVMAKWLSSTGHRRNIKREAYNEIGLGHAVSSTGTSYWCVVFGSQSFAGDDSWLPEWSEPEFAETCQGCNGTGKRSINTDMCNYCRGAGILTVETMEESRGRDYGNRN